MKGGVWVSEHPKTINLEDYDYMTQTEWRNIFSSNLLSILEEKGMSQRQLAKDSGVSLTMINDYINKRCMPGLIAIVNMAYALDINVDEFIDFGEWIEC